MLKFKETINSVNFKNNIDDNKDKEKQHENLKSENNLPSFSSNTTGNKGKDNTNKNLDYKKCAICNKKLKLTNCYDCSCNEKFFFCSEHKLKELHNCSQLDKTLLRDKLSKILPKVEKDKVHNRL